MQDSHFLKNGGKSYFLSICCKSAQMFWVGATISLVVPIGSLLYQQNKDRNIQELQEKVEMLLQERKEMDMPPQCPDIPTPPLQNPTKTQKVDPGFAK